MINKILIVEDERDLNDMYATVIENCGFTPEQIFCYDDVNRSLLGSYSAFILDHVMKEGPHGCEWVKTNGIYLPVNKRILVSGNSGWVNTEGLTLHKPFRIKQLEEAILECTKDSGY
jgi:DNA-binding NtrC family response regulator